MAILLPVKNCQQSGILDLLAFFTIKWVLTKNVFIFALNYSTQVSLNIFGFVLDLWLEKTNQVFAYLSEKQVSRVLLFYLRLLLMTPMILYFIIAVL